MNLRDTYRVLKEELPNLDYQVNSYKDKEYDYIFGNIGKFVDAYNRVNRLAPFLITDDIANAVSFILKANVPNLGYNVASSKKLQGDQAIEAIYKLRSATEAFVTFIEQSVLQGEDENSIHVKLIHIESLEDLEKTANLLKRAFNVPSFELDGQITVGRVESGSVWIDLIVGGVAVGALMKLCANLIWAAVAIRNKIKETKQNEEFLRTTKLKNDLLEGLVKHNLEYISQVKQAEAQHIVNEFMAGRNTPDLQTQINGSIEAIGTLVDKGAEFYPSLKAPEEIKMLFPDFGVKELLESKIKLLSEGKEDKKD